VTRRDLFEQLCNATNALQHVTLSLACGPVKDALAAVVTRLDGIIDAMVLELGAASSSSSGAGQRESARAGE
jgi:hypothetical protein